MNPEELKDYIKEFYPNWYAMGFYNWEDVLDYLQRKNGQK